jgi:hypothetical protein
MEGENMVWPGDSKLTKIGQKLRMRHFLKRLREVEKLRPIDTNSGRGDVAIGFLTCHRHVGMMMLAAKSFYHFSGIICPLYVWDDGSLLPSDRDRLRRLFPNACILRKSELDMKMLAQYPLTASFAERRLKNYEVYAPSLKIFGPLASPNAPTRFILSDSDAFFFDWPQTIIDWLEESHPTNRYIAPMSGHDNVSEDELNGLYAKLHLSSCPRINSGLLLLHRASFKLHILEQILEWYQDRSYAWDIEQTIYRILLASSDSKPFNQDDYVLCLRKYNAVCHHFFTSVIEDEPVVRKKIINLLEYIRDSERRHKPPVIAAKESRRTRVPSTPEKGM